MQRFIAELSTPVDQSEFEKSWKSDSTVSETMPNVQFTFSDRRVSAVMESASPNRWPSAAFYRIFSAAVRRVDRACNVRWL
jgi:hypothetical protein